MKPLTELSLFSGAGGGLLASKYMMKWRTIGYVENEKHPQKVIAARIKDGLLDEAPIFTDIREFNGQGYAGSYKGLVDVVSGGFPCQDISCAGRGEGLDGSRSSLWFAMLDTIRIVGPRFVFVENSPLLRLRGLDTVLKGLASIGYDARWGCLSAAQAGAKHKRNRMWLVAHSRCRSGGHDCPQTS